MKTIFKLFSIFRMISGLRQQMSDQAAQLAALERENDALRVRLDGAKLQHSLVRSSVVRALASNVALAETARLQIRDVSLTLNAAATLGDRAKKIIADHDKGWHKVLDKLEDENRGLIASLSSRTERQHLDS